MQKRKKSLCCPSKETFSTEIETKNNGDPYSKRNTCLQKRKQGVAKKEIDSDAKGNTNTKTSSKISSHILKINEKDWSLTFSKEEKDYLAFLLKIVPEVGESISLNTATWWIKNFGKEKIEIALKVYWEQVTKAKNNKKIPLPQSIGAYVRHALNKNLRPFEELDLKNKNFAENFKLLNELKNLTIREKYCRAEGLGKEWYYSLPENLFKESLESSYMNFGNF